MVCFPVNPDLTKRFSISHDGPEYVVTPSPNGCLLVATIDGTFCKKPFQIELPHHIGLSAETLTPVLEKVNQPQAATLRRVMN